MSVITQVRFLRGASCINVNVLSFEIVRANYVVSNVCVCVRERVYTHARACAYVGVPNRFILANNIIIIVM